MRKNSQTSLPIWVSLLALGAIAGCGQSDRPTVVPVSGKILYKGDPVEGAQVTFHPTGTAPRKAGGTTDAEGKFVLTTFDTGDGAVPGEHIVTIYLPEQQETGDEEELDPSDPGAAYDQAMQAASFPSEAEYQGQLPEKYASPETSPEKRTVTEEGPNEFTIELKE